MEATPIPMDTNRLKNILLNAKKVMAAVEEKSPTKKASKVVTESYDDDLMYQPVRQTPSYDERDEREPNYSSQYPNTQGGGQSMEVRDYTTEDVMNSKLPPAIKEAMLKNPIPRLQGPPSNFSLEGLEDLIEKPTGQRKQIRETARPTSDMISISKAELNEMIDKRVSEVLAQMFTKTLAEQTIKKTMNVLISEGKLAVKKKV